MKRGLIRVLVLLAASTTLAAQAERPRARNETHSNILFLMADEFRHDCLGSAGHSLVRTPNLDRLAREGIRFSRAYTASPVCSPSRATLFTGRYPQIHGVIQNGMALAAGEIGLPELLKHYGYASGMVGKLHLPPGQWFTPALITAGGRGAEYEQFLQEKVPGFKGISNTAAKPETLIGPPRTPLRIGTSVLPEALYEEAWVADRAIEFLRAQKDGSRPWFLFVSMLKPHSEFVIPEPYATMYKPEEMPLPASFRADARPPDEAWGRNERAFIRDPEVMRAVIAHYYGAIALVDRHMGRVLDELERLGMARDTIVVFTADHGNMLGERNRMFKGVMYESSARVPLLFRAPGRIRPGQVSDQLLDNSTVMPTLLELAGIPIPAGIQGRSLVPATRGERIAGAAYSVLHHRMVRRGDWKLIDPHKATGAAPELYNLARDPAERHNLYGRTEAAGPLSGRAIQEAQRSLTGALEAWWKEKPPPVKLPGNAK
jgi:arylsulfatase A-like enzyme